MHFMSISENGHLAFTGRHYVHVFSTRYIGSKSTRLHLEGSGALSSLDLHKYIPKAYTGTPDRISTISCSISSDAGKLAVIDWEKNIYIFERYVPQPTALLSVAAATMCHRSIWYFFASFRMDMNIIRAQFDKRAENLFFIDRHGNALISSTETPEKIVRPVQLIHHSAVTMDLIQDESGQMLFTCDGIANILYSLYGEDSAKKREGLGQYVEPVNAIRITPPTTPIANFVLFNHDSYIMLAHKNGVIDLWDFDAAKHLHSWDIFKIIHGVTHESDPEHEIQRLKLSDVYDHAYFAVKLATYKELPVFDLDLLTKNLRKLGQVRLDYEYSDFVWSHDVLYVYNPEHQALMKRYIVSSNGVLCDPVFHITTVLGHLPDFKSFVDFHKESIDLTDYLSSASVSSRPGRRAIQEIFKASTDDKIQHSLFMRAKKRIANNRATNKKPSILSSTELLEENSNYYSRGSASKSVIPAHVLTSAGHEAHISNDESHDELQAMPGPSRAPFHTLSRIPVPNSRRTIASNEYAFHKQSIKGFEIGGDPE